MSCTTIKQNVPAGSTIRFTSTLPKNVSEYTHIYIYLYTSELLPQKYYYGSKTGFLSLELVDLNKVRAVLKGSQTRKMSGDLTYEIFLYDTIVNVEPEDIGIGSKKTNINITKSLIGELA